MALVARRSLRVGRRVSARQDLLQCVAGQKLSELDAGQTGGVYAMSPNGKKQSAVAVFKPDVEEHFERRGIPTGGGAMREEAVYLLDRLALAEGSSSDVTPARVPVTTQGDVPSPEDSPTCKTRAVSHGAIQRFVQDVAGASDDFGMPKDIKEASQVVSVAAVQHVAILDIRVCNTDRHPGNLLLQQNVEDDDARFVPIPIDHGCCLPRWWAVGEANFEAWMDWPQAHVPCEPEVVQTVRRAYEMRGRATEQLENLQLEPSAMATHRIVLALLFEGIVRHGLSVSQVGRLIARDPFQPGTPSWLELKLEECCVKLGALWRWTENKYGDRVPAAPADPAAWPPEGLVEMLEALFATNVVRDFAELLPDAGGLD